MVQLAQSCQADMQRHKAMAINELRDLLTADLLVCTVLLSQSGPDQELTLSWQQTHTQTDYREVKTEVWMGGGGCPRRR